MNESICIFWFRRDLRLDDNAGLYRALLAHKKVLPLFIFDTNILERLENKLDRRVDFIHQNVLRIKTELQQLGSDLLVKYGEPEKIYRSLLKEYNINGVYANHDYEPGAIKRDKVIEDLLKENNISFNTFKDQCIFEKSEVTKDDGTPYTVFTPYSRKWKQKLNSFYTKSYPTEKYFDSFFKCKKSDLIPLEKLGFQKTDVHADLPKVKKNIIVNYDKTRDFPALLGTSRLSIHLRFGTISIRKLAAHARSLNETYLNELIWRDFYMMILFHFPQVEHTCFKPAYSHIAWRNNEKEFEAWCKGETGYTIVDAGMRELNATGFMHNRVRMIVASFLTKHLLIDYKWGEAYFAQKLNDFDLSANNGGWQWAAGCGCDAAPYFRVFSPYEQIKKFDSNFEYIKKWVPEYNTNKYVKEIVDHKFARERVLTVYKKALNRES